MIFKRFNWSLRCSIICEIKHKQTELKRNKKSTKCITKSANAPSVYEFVENAYISLLLRRCLRVCTMNILPNAIQCCVCYFFFFFLMSVMHVFEDIWLCINWRKFDESMEHMKTMLFPLWIILYSVYFLWLHETRNALLAIFCCHIHTTQ